MELEFNKLLLKTAFACMACDGEIDNREITLIKEMHNALKLFGDIDIVSELNSLVEIINKDGKKFIGIYFDELTKSELSIHQELKIIKVAIDTIKADEKIEYSEIKFFKVIRSKLKIDNDSILVSFPEIEDYLENDIISQSYLSNLQDGYFDDFNLTEFQTISVIDNDSVID
jgi:uncharacterized tellurite resistance protein B-like protein